MEEETRPAQQGPQPILHVLVVGFHHKKGCQVEYSYPPLVPGDPDPTACPPGWKYLPTLALPDGSHNFDSDAVYFHLPSLTDAKRTVFGISCYRQISVEKLKVRAADVTRSTVQKSVCVLSRLPLYGHVEVKMNLITHAYFEEGDFSQVRLLHDTYEHLNSCMDQLPPLHDAPQLFVGLSPRDLILAFGHKTLLLFKLLLLERRVVFFRSPVQPLCATILTLLSLHPGMIERGLFQSACIKPSRPMSPIPDFVDADYEVEDTPIVDAAAETNLKTNLKKEETSSVQTDSTTSALTAGREDGNTQNIDAKLSPKAPEIVEKLDIKVPVKENGKADQAVRPSRLEISSGTETEGSEVAEEARSEGADSWIDVADKMTGSDSSSNLAALGSSVDGMMATIATADSKACGLPLPLFELGNLCLPYLSLPFMDLLADVNVRGFVVGATNVLFKQKRGLADVLVEVESGRVETQDTELRRQLHLSTEDLRFADYVTRRVIGERHDVFLDGVGWEGGDEWIRSMFKAYALCMLRTSLLQDGSRELEHFNSSFMSAWKQTYNYRSWAAAPNEAIWDLNPGHPFAGTLSVADMKLRLSHTMHNTEGGRKLNQAMTQTGRAVGGALSHAKGALSNWWTTLTAVETSPRSAEEELPEEEDPSFDIGPPEMPAELPTLLQGHASPAKLAGIQTIECCPPKVEESEAAKEIDRVDQATAESAAKPVNEQSDSKQGITIVKDVSKSGDHSDNLRTDDTLSISSKKTNADENNVDSIETGLRKPKVEIV